MKLFTLRDKSNRNQIDYILTLKPESKLSEDDIQRTIDDCYQAWIDNDEDCTLMDKIMAELQEDCEFHAVGDGNGYKTDVPDLFY